MEEPNPHPYLRLAVVNEHTKRDKDAHEVKAQFADACDKMTIECPHMAAYLIVVFDDHGRVQSKLYVGDAFPISDGLIPQIAKDAARARVHN